jgi:uncharacterized Zn finger protein (UPF0148 family)
MEQLRIWQEISIDEIKEQIVIVDDTFGHCPNCKEIGIELKGLTHCPSCSREFNYVTSKEASHGKHDIVVRIRKKLPHMTFVDYDDYIKAVGQKDAQNLFSV